MAWFSGKVSLGNFPDLAGAVNKLSESVKNIEKNFDSALGLEEKSDSTSSEASGLWPVMSFMGQKGDDRNTESSGKTESPQKLCTVEEYETHKFATEESAAGEEKQVLKNEKEDEQLRIAEEKDVVVSDPIKPASDVLESVTVPVETPETVVHDVKTLDSVDSLQERKISEDGPAENSDTVESKSGDVRVDQVDDDSIMQNHSFRVVDSHESTDEQKTPSEGTVDESSPVQAETSKIARVESLTDNQAGAAIDPSGLPVSAEEIETTREASFSTALPLDEAPEMVPESSVSSENDVNIKTVGEEKQGNDGGMDIKEQRLSPASSMSDSTDASIDVEKMNMEMKMMETALQGAARQAQAKADEIAKLMNENEQLKAVIEDLKRKSTDAEIESLREEYHQRVATLERKVYALTKERDTLRREQNRKSDAAALLKEKDEIISQVMAEGEELSKKQAAQESTIRKLRAQIREFEEEKKGLMTKLQVEENKVESIKKDKTATEKLLQETIEKHQTELSAQKEFYTNALTAAKEAETLAEARANNEARTELESRLREAEERESMLVQALEELRQTLSRKEQQAVFREDMLRRDIEDLQKRYQASERRCEELVTQVPESTRPLLRQIEAMQETMARRAEAWSAVERSLNSRLQEAEAKAATAEERERTINERLSQTLSRINVLEAQISCLRAEQTQLSKSLEKERQRAAENRQEYLAAKEEAETQKGRANQLEEEIKELRQRHKQELQDALMHRELLQQEVEREKAARLELERTVRVHSTTISDQTPITKGNSGFENGNLNRKLSNASSMEESYFLQASLDTSDSFSERRNPGEASMSPYFMKSMTPSTFESALRQKEGELASYISRLTSMESIRDSLAEELVKMTAQCEKLQAESALVPGIRAELEALRRRHSAALELMGERDEELEELRADIVDLKEMYREQVNLLVNKIQVMSPSVGNA
ncbi:golgin candidate 5 [Ricinus communis]|uniref:golgin candidate 5 n=1 Tax=Ricinus communis TaxID=3988 RepID=UPI00201AD84A|nr:golgin candidate 5 [Ricinus communis]